jgi:hypothetical protein
MSQSVVTGWYDRQDISAAVGQEYTYICGVVRTNESERGPPQ